MAMYKSNNKFLAQYCYELIECFARGGSRAEFLAERDVVCKTFYNWLDRYPEFKEAYAVAQQKGEAYWQKKLHENVGNKDFDLNAAKFIMGGRFGVTSKRKLNHKAWLDTKDLMGSLNRVIDMLDGGLSCEEFTSCVDDLLKLANLKEKEELEARVAEIEDRLKI